MERERARLFDREAERYDRIRPPYQDAAIDEVLGPSPTRPSVLDVACGTGIASRQMAQRGAQVLGVELNPRMAEVAGRHGIQTEVAPFETWDPEGRTFDRVTCAQAWHWLDQDVCADKAASVLRPGGRLCLLWNIGHHADEVADNLAAAYRRVLSDEHELVIGYAVSRSTDPAAVYSVLAESAAGALRACAALTEPETRVFLWDRTYTAAQWIDELMTHSDHLALPPETRERLWEEIGEAIDDFGGTFRLGYTTVLVSATRR